MSAMTANIHALPITMEGRSEMRLALVHDGEMIGVASLASMGRETVTIYQLYVAEAHRRCHWGAALVERAEMEASARGAGAMSAVVMADGPHGFWERLGYTVAHCEMDRVIVSKRL